MILVDDRLCLDVLAGRKPGTSARRTVTATTWAFHLRLLRALSDEGRVGALTRASSRDLYQLALAPPPGTLVVLDPRAVTHAAATLAARHGLNLLAAELVAAALANSAKIVLAAGNVGRGWPDVFAAEGIAFEVVG